MSRITLVLLGWLAAGGVSSPSLPTRLYVRTFPPGAKSFWTASRWAHPMVSLLSHPAGQNCAELDGHTRLARSRSNLNKSRELRCNCRDSPNCSAINSAAARTTGMHAVMSSFRRRWPAHRFLS